MQDLGCGLIRGAWLGSGPSRVKPLLSSPKPHSFLPASQFHLLQEAFPDCPPLDLAMLNLRSGEQFPEQGLVGGRPRRLFGRQKVGRSQAGSDFSVCGCVQRGDSAVGMGGAEGFRTGK